MSKSSSTKTKRTRIPKQLPLLKPEPRFFGGRLLYKKRKGRRPLAFKEAIHVVMRSLWAQGEHSFRAPRNRKAIEAIIATLAKRYGVTVYRQTLMSNHIHFVLRLTNRESYKAFIRVLTGQIASHVMQQQSFEAFQRQCLASSSLATTPATLIEPQGVGQKFFQFRPFTRVLHWGCDFKTCCAYVVQNTLEALGFIPYKPRKDHYAKWLAETLDDLQAMA